MDEHKFDFTEWLIEYQLNDIKECFTDYDMSTLDTLDLSNVNFVKLMADERILSTSHLIQNIVNGLQSLEKLRNLQNTEVRHTERRLIFMTPREHNIFTTIEDYIDCLNDLHHKICSSSSEEIQDRKRKNNRNIATYSAKNTLKLDAIRSTIDETSKKLHDILNEKEEILQDQVTKYRNDVKNVGQNHTESVQKINQLLSQCLSMMDRDIKHYAKSIEECKEIVNKYEENQDETNANENNYSLRRCNSDMRELEIVKIGENVTNFYNKNLMIFNENRQKINEYIENELILNMKPTYSVTIFDAIRDSISHHIDKLIETRNVTQTAPDPLNKIERNAINQWNAIVNEEETKIKEEDAFDDDDDDEDILNDINDINDINVKNITAGNAEVEQPPAAFSSFSQNFNISSLLNIEEENKQPLVLSEPNAAHSAPPPAIVHAKHVRSESEEKEKGAPPPYNPQAPKASKREIYARASMAKSLSAKNARAAPPAPKMNAMQKHKSDGSALEGMETDSHARYKQALANKDAVGKKHASFETYWQCTVCTFAENPGTFLMCKLCNATRQLSVRRQHSLSDGAAPFLQQSNFKERKDSNSAKVEQSDEKQQENKDKKAQHNNDKKQEKRGDVKRSQAVKDRKENSVKDRKENSGSKIFGWKRGKKGKKGAKKGNK